MLSAIETYMLIEAFRIAYAHAEGPLPNIQPTWGWGLDFFLSQFAPRYSPFIYFANFWLELRELFWQNSLEEPLSEVSSTVLRKDILELLSLHAHLPIHVSYHGSLSQAYDPTTKRMFPSTFITFSRTDFLHPQVVSNIGSLGLKLREGFDSKRRPRVSWTSSQYLQQHRERHAEYLQFLAEEPNSS